MICWATGGPHEYTGRSMKDSHQHLMITAIEWEAFLDDLPQTLDKFAVPQGEQAEIKGIVASTRADIVV
jgi:hemoglobin